MRKRIEGFSIVDFLIIMAILLIVIGMFGSHLSKGRNKTDVSAAPAVSSASAR
jgi:hypothetical protein